MSRFSRHLVFLFAGCLWGHLGTAQDLSHRQSAVTVRVQNLLGAPLSGATVKVEMINPAFRFGTAIVANEMYPGTAEFSAQGLAVLQANFNSVTLGNELKWTYVENRTPAATQDMINDVISLHAFDSDIAMNLRGHTTVWGAAYQLPADLRAMTDPTQVRTRIRNHVTNYHTQLADSGIRVFDLYNEHFHERQYIIDKAVPGGTVAQQAAEVAEWFKAARAADPNAVLYINEYNILNFWQENDADVIAYKQFVDAVRDAGGPVDGIGEQAHMDRFITKEQIRRRLAILGAPMAPTANHPAGLPGLRLEITELDINTQWWTTATPTEQAQVTANVLEGAFETPAVDGVTIWGMRDSIHWRGNAILYDDSNPASWVLKPSGQAWVDRVKGTWWTNLNGAAGANGEYGATVFKGRHRVTVTYNGVEQVIERDLTSPQVVDVRFDAPGDPVDTTSSRLSNVSVRTLLEADQRVIIGFVLSGGAKDVLVRTAGPALDQFGLQGMPDPRIELYDADAAIIGQNDDWDPALASTFATLGAFDFADGSNDSALVQNLAGLNSAHAFGATRGVALVEAYDASPGGPAHLVNVSARNYVGTGSDALIAGFSVPGTGYKHLLIRAIGPKLTAYGVGGVLADPQLAIYDSGGSLRGGNDNWPANLAPLFAQLQAFPLDDGSLDAAVEILLPANATYTAVVTGVGNTTGVALVEVYEVE